MYSCNERFRGLGQAEFRSPERLRRCASEEAMVSFDHASKDVNYDTIRS